VHRAHGAAISFENLDIVLGRPLGLDVDSLQDKLVRRRRGGYCHEQNSLLAAALDRAGFEVDRLVARSRHGSAKPRPRTHMLLAVRCAGTVWLADVGYGGGGLLEPVPLEDGLTVTQGGWSLRLDREPDGAWCLRTLRDGGWFDLYAFTTEPQHRVDLAMANHYTETSPSSPFVREPMAQRIEPHVRYVLRGPELTVARPDGSEQYRRVRPEEYAEVLAEVFGIELDEDAAARLRQVLTERGATLVP
jgi:N-hydroxyarylamine O-acetyltransferase